jgi:hypothetical protein
MLGIQAKIANSGILPFYMEGATANILLPILLGAIVTAIYTVGIQRVRSSETEKTLPWTVVVEGVIIGAVGTVAWWVIPLAVFLLAQAWLMYSSALGVVLDELAGALFGEFIFVGGYIGAAIGGGILGGALGTFVTGVARELIGSRPWNSKKLLVIGLIIGAGLGTVYGLIWFWNWMHIPFN